MNKTKILVICAALLSVVACDKISGPHGRFIEMCKEDPRAKDQGFDCKCQADIIQAVLKDDEMNDLVHFLDVEKQDRNKAIELGKDPKYTPMFQKIAGIGLAIHDKCSKPGSAEATPAPAAQPTQTPVATPAPKAAAPAPAKPAKESQPEEPATE